MFKSKLQEYCQSKAWVLPGYGVKKEGEDHCPLFKAVVEVNGVSFTSPNFCRTSKDAQNSAAKLALEHFTGCSKMGNAVTSEPVSSNTRMPETQQTTPIVACDSTSGVTEDNSVFKAGIHMYKNQFQIWAERRKLELPVYSVESIGPTHANRHKCKVTFEDKTYESEDYFRTIKEAENAAAKVALVSIFPRGFEEEDPSIYKNLLHREILCLPKYTTTSVGPSHMPVFVSMVEIQGESFRGQEAKTKKQAEMNVAKVAYITLRDRRCRQDDNVNALGAHLTEVLQFSSVNVPEGETDTQTLFDKQVECNQEEELKATYSGTESCSWSNDLSSRMSSKLVGGLYSLDKEEEKRKKKITVFPSSFVTWSHPDDHVMHRDDKWIAFTTGSC